MKLNLEPLEAREVPTTLADILPHYDPVTYQRPMPDVPPDRVLVAMADIDGPGVVGGLVDVYAAHGSGNAARIVLREDGRPVADFFAFEDTFRGGVSSVAVIGRELFVAPGAPGGPRVVAIDLTTFAVRSFLSPGFAESWRGGLKLAVADVDEPDGFTEAVSAEPDSELLVMAASFGAGPVVAFAEPDGSAAAAPIFVSAPDDRREWEFVPAATGVQLSSGKMGFSVQPAGSRPDATGHVTETRSYSFRGGELAPSDHEFPLEYDFAPIVV